MPRTKTFLLAVLIASSLFSVVGCGGGGGGDKTQPTPTPTPTPTPKPSPSPIPGQVDFPLPDDLPKPPTVP